MTRLRDLLDVVLVGVELGLVVSLFGRVLVFVTALPHEYLYLEAIVLHSGKKSERLQSLLDS